ncbi:MAG: transcription elongation factor GreA [Oscillospiraceae bacterium]|jgi:transcription elongation factor GreA|nr:transcription elongation factor GreA [Oscillospiraceae bacterium]
MAENKTVLTQERYDALMAELEKLRTVGRDDIAEKLRVARSYGDLSENAEYNETMDEQAKMESQIAELEAELRNVEIIATDDMATDVVAIGVIVKVKDLVYGDIETFQMLGTGGLEDGILSDASPLGKALLGKRVGETVEFYSPTGNGKILRYEVLDISH